MASRTSFRRLLLLGLAVVAVIWAVLNVLGVMRDHDRAPASPDRAAADERAGLGQGR